MADTDAVTVICAECGEVIEVKNVVALVLSLHLQNACEQMREVVGDGS